MERKSVFVANIARSCNNNCVFCMEGRVRSTSEFTLEKFRKIVEEHDIIDFSSGEPTTNPSLARYVALAKAAGFRSIEMTTNGRMLSVPGFAEKLAGAGMNHFKISIHGSTPFLHDALTRTPGSFEQAIGGLKKVLEIKRQYGLEADVLTTMVKQNFKDLPGMVGLFSKFDIDRWNINIFDPSGTVEDRAETLLPRYSEVEKSFHEVMEAKGVELMRKGTEVSISIPACILRDKLKKYYSNYEEIVMEKNDVPRKQPVRRGRSFLPACGKCRARHVCDGIWKKYLELYGGEEIKPVTNTALLDKDLQRRNLVKPK